MRPLLAAPLAVALAVLAPRATLADETGRRIVVEYENTAGGQVFSTSAFVTHRDGVHLWQQGKPASLPIRQMAEEGNPEWVLGTAVLSGGKDFGAAAAFPPVPPGGRGRLELTVTQSHPDISGVFMLGQTNDGFAGLDAVDALHLTGPKTVEVYALDAGTSKNVEDKKHLRAFEGFAREAEGGVIAPHPGIKVGGVIPKEWAFDPKQPVARITLTPAAPVGE